MSNIMYICYGILYCTLYMLFTEHRLLHVPYTPISIIICNQNTSNAYNIDMAVDTDISGGDIQYILYEQSVPSKGTFVFNDKFVLHPSDALKFRVNVDASGDNFSVYISFIDQAK